MQRQSMQDISISLKTSHHLAAGHDFQQIYYLGTLQPSAEANNKHTERVQKHTTSCRCDFKILACKTNWNVHVEYKMRWRTQPFLELTMSKYSIEWKIITKFSWVKKNQSPKFERIQFSCMFLLAIFGTPTHDAKVRNKKLLRHVIMSLSAAVLVSSYFCANLQELPLAPPPLWGSISVLELAQKLLKGRTGCSPE